MDPITTLIAIFSLLAIAWVMGLLAWSRHMNTRYCRLLRARAQAYRENDPATWSTMGRALSELWDDWEPGCRAISPWHWVRTWRRDYIMRATIKSPQLHFPLPRNIATDFEEMKNWASRNQ